MTTELTQTAQQPNPISLLIGQDMSTIDADKMDKLLSLQERWEKQQAEKALNVALSTFQRNAPVILKTRKTNNSDYASLDDIMQTIRTHLADNGLSVSFDTETLDKSLKATCYVLHIDGASFNRSVTVPVDVSMRGANVSQQMGSATSYAKRYALVAALNLIVSDHDDDGAAAGSAYVTPDQIKEIDALVSKLPADRREAFLEWINAETVAHIKAADFDKAISQLKKAAK